MNSRCELVLRFIIVIISSILVITATGDDYGRERELKALSNWWPFNSSETSHHCNWSGITCNRAGRVAEMRSPQGCRASDPYWDRQLDELDVLAFPHLTAIHLTGCRDCLYGEIPAEIGMLVNLTYIDLSHNTLSGKLNAFNNIGEVILPDIGHLTSLESLDLSNNEISGPLPSSLGQLTKLESLILSNNEISDSLPSSLGQLKRLVKLDLSNNSISGTVTLHEERPGTEERSSEKPGLKRDPWGTAAHKKEHETEERSW